MNGGMKETPVGAAAEWDNVKTFLSQQNHQNCQGSFGAQYSQQQSRAEVLDCIGELHLHATLISVQDESQVRIRSLLPTKGG